MREKGGGDDHKMVEFCQPYSQALHHCMNDIIHTVSFDYHVALQLYCGGIIEVASGEYDKLLNLADEKEAIKQVVNKVITMNSQNAYKKFLEVLSTLNYTELVDRIEAEYKRVMGESAVGNHNIPLSPMITRRTAIASIAPPLSLSSSSSTTNLSFSQSGSSNADPDPDQRSSATGQITNEIAIENNKLKSTQRTIAVQAFLEYLLCMGRVFLRVVNDGKVQLVQNADDNKNDLENEVDGSITILKHIKHKFCDEKEDSDDLLQYVLEPILLGSANTIVDTISKPSWKWIGVNMNAMLLLCERMMRVVRGKEDIDHRLIFDMTVHIEHLNAYLNNAGTMLEKMINSQVVLTVTTAAGAAVCIIIGAALICTPGAVATIPLLIAGGVLAWQALVHGGLIVVISK